VLLIAFPLVSGIVGVWEFSQVDVMAPSSLASHWQERVASAPLGTQSSPSQSFATSPTRAHSRREA
jgi:hypothetical protein